MKTIAILTALALLFSCSGTASGTATGTDLSAYVLKIEAGGEVMRAAFENNSSAEAFIEKLKSGPVTVDMHDYGSFEKVGPLGFSLPRNDINITTVPGDVILYQGNQITIYYDQNTWTFTRLAKINDSGEDRIRSILGSGNVTVTFSLEEK